MKDDIFETIYRIMAFFFLVICLMFIVPVCETIYEGYEIQKAKKNEKTVEKAVENGFEKIENIKNNYKNDYGDSYKNNMNEKTNAVKEYFDDLNKALKD
jgi:hypothetical protein